MNTDPTDLINIVSSSGSQIPKETATLSEQPTQEKNQTQITDSNQPSTKSEEPIASNQHKHTTNAITLLQKQKHQALFILNIFRYCLALYFIICITASHFVNVDWLLGTTLTSENRTVFLFCAATLLITATFFSYLLQAKETMRYFNWLIFGQLLLDLSLTTFVIHQCGSIHSNHTFYFFVIVATGSLVLPKRRAIGLAAGSILLLFYEHIVSVSYTKPSITLESGLLVRYGIMLFAIAWVLSNLVTKLSYLSNALEQNKKTSNATYNPDKEPLDTFLQNEEIKALKTALEKNNHNKTQAAESLGMSFRSFRYKLKKYDISD